MAEVKDFKTVKVEKNQGIAWVIQRTLRNRSCRQSGMSSRRRASMRTMRTAQLTACSRRG